MELNEFLRIYQPRFGIDIRLAKGTGIEISGFVRTAGWSTKVTKGGKEPFENFVGEVQQTAEAVLRSRCGARGFQAMQVQEVADVSGLPIGPTDGTSRVMVR